MSDSIDRTLAIATLVMAKETGSLMCKELKGVIEVLNRMPPAQRWIPCSERLPSKADHTDDMVLVCYRNGSVRFNTYMNGWVQGNPVAWMPLPEPYKEVSE